VFRPALRGYRFGTRDRWEPTIEEWEAFPVGLHRICVELSARFAADALKESYFGWDPAAFPARGEHNLVRAQGQLSLAQDVAKKRTVLEAISGILWSL